MTRLLVVMGSGETTPTMVTPHQQVFAALGPDPVARLLDTPYGFQENADDITTRTCEYFSRNVGSTVEALGLRDVGSLTDGELERIQVAARDADWLFAGPGSPSYLLRQWGGTRLPAILRERLDRRGATVFASAAAVTLGTHAIPVYELYKAGHEPHWLEGLDVLGALGWRTVVVPHFDNAEGGTHDTRYCYLGERRLARLEDELPDGTWVLGVDEHTAAVFDLDARTVEVQGRGVVTVRVRDRATTFAAGTVGFDELLAAAHGSLPPRAGPRGSRAGEPAAGDGRDATAEAAAPATSPRSWPGVSPTASPLLDAVLQAELAFDTALRSGAAIRAGEVALTVEALVRDWSADTNVSDEVDRARAVLRRMVVRLAEVADAGLHDHREVVAPLVESLLELRRGAREEGRYDVADRIRDDLVRGGVEVRDTAAGPEWDHTR